FSLRPTTELYTRHLHDALPIYRKIEADVLPLDDDVARQPPQPGDRWRYEPGQTDPGDHDAHDDQHPSRMGHQCFSARFPRAFRLDRKSTRLNSSHVKISYAVFC